MFNFRSMEEDRLANIHEYQRILLKNIDLVLLN